MSKQKIIRVLKNVSIFIAVLPLAFSFMLSYFQITPPAFNQELLFDDTCQFIILTLPNLQLGRKGFSQKNRDDVVAAIQQTKPDLVILGGNNVFIQPLFADLFFSYTMDIIDKYVSIFEEEKVFFTVIFGDMDTKGLYNKSAQTKRFMRSKYFVGGVIDTGTLPVFYQRRKDIVGNYKIRIKGLESDVFLYMADCQSLNTLSEEQIDWLTEQDDNTALFVFSYKKLYEINQEGTVDYVFATENVKAFISFNKINEHSIIIENCIYLLEISSDNKYFVITITEDGNLLF